MKFRDSFKKSPARKCAGVSGFNPRSGTGLENSCKLHFRFWPQVRNWFQNYVQYSKLTELVKFPKTKNGLK